MHGRQCCRGSVWQCWAVRASGKRQCSEHLWDNAAANPADPPLRQALANPTRTAVLRHRGRGAVARVVDARERPDEMRGGCIRATRARRRAATVPAGGADGGLAPDWTRSRDGVVPGASRRDRRSLARGHAQSWHRFCGITFSSRAPRDISHRQMSRQYSQGTAPHAHVRTAAERARGGPPCCFSSPREAALRSPPRQCRTMPWGAARQCFRQCRQYLRTNQEAAPPHIVRENMAVSRQCLAVFGSTEPLP